MDHTFLFKEGTWFSTGKFYGSRNNAFSAEARMVVTHLQELWLVESFVKLLLDKPVEFQNRYEIKPIQSDHTDWYSFNPERGGDVHGKFMVVEDTIFSTYASDNGVFSSLESTVKISDDAYTVKGFAFKEGKKQSSWSLDFKRAK
ncbi:MAG: hypothetical protein ACYCX4_12285 [Bacillota bacterium]